MNNITTLAELAKILGVSRQRAYQLREQLGIGERRAGLWLIDAADVEIAKNNCQTYLLANR